MPSTRSNVDWRAIFGEFLATGLFVWAGCGVAVASSRWGAENFTAADLVAIALGFGLAITTLAYAFGHISGGHMNPAVTLAFVWLRLMDWMTGLFYVLAQCVGAWMGALILWGCSASLTQNCGNENASAETWSLPTSVCEASRTPDGGYGPPYGLGANQVAERVTNACAFLIEAVGTFILIITVLNSAVHRKSEAKNAAPIAIGWAVLIAHLVLVPFTGCGINPARALGPLVVNSMGGSNRWTRGWWVYFTAPWVGSLLAALAYQYVFMPGEAERRKKDDGDKVQGDLEDGRRDTSSNVEDMKNETMDDEIET
uniref:Aquaporin n=1 Tax=Pseudictyota dubia TaxID=2749911 RepID=A0A7R9WIQ8_9STRA|mmetsp:Transcript_5123/g.8876  ORF Transcript_5123/g.8876 Transcript_5123/m.8876 type:complete len:313 (+) Transcript_5123:103-1041(+)|eukprot:CAMPEP_0197436418 /NCGR_PEP_ID=MMETSP1175-20131217/3863_1 /TAXON_ID=1003142 /ORGANISM="Triceratium dubium, Strain CCMP147" /LENGTH=312 /DNA_ID=CAMNT_0042965697 /DNA_START=58 /DNA_END=996 /DNA_ORIENTATION=-